MASFKECQPFSRQVTKYSTFSEKSRCGAHHDWVFSWPALCSTVGCGHFSDGLTRHGERLWLQEIICSSSWLSRVYFQLAYQVARLIQMRIALGPWAATNFTARLRMNRSRILGCHPNMIRAFTHHLPKPRRFVKIAWRIRIWGLASRRPLKNLGNEQLQSGAFLKWVLFVVAFNFVELRTKENLVLPPNRLAIECQAHVIE